MEHATSERPLLQSLLRGFRRRCPACGAGPIFEGFLATRDRCPACNEQLNHHRADDGPAYLTILIVGHLMAPVLLTTYTLFRPDPLVLIATLGIGCVASSLWLLPRLKGALIGVQWAKRMHGFGEEGVETPAE